MTLLEFIRGLVRPTITWAAFVSIVAMLFLRIDIPEWYQILVSGILMFWFAQRGNNGVSNGH